MQTFNIGRDANNQIVLNDSLVSRSHAQLTVLDNRQVMIKDLGSSNGTFVNGNRITECYLNSGDVVKCGSVFLNWAQYIGKSNQPSASPNYQQEDRIQPPYQDVYADSTVIQYGLGGVFKYLTTRIFEIGNLFKTNWDRKTSIIFLKVIPVAMIFFISLIIYSRFPSFKFYFSPTILALFVFAVAPFITLLLLSINKKTETNKVALASGIMGFLQFSAVLVYFLARWILNVHWSNGYGSGNFLPAGLDILSAMVILLAIMLLVNMTIAFFTFLYNYFISIGFRKSKSIYLTVISVCLNQFFQFLSVYLIYLIVNDNNGYKGFF